VDFLVRIPKAVLIQTIREMVRVRGAVSVPDILCETGADPERIIEIMREMAQAGEGRIEWRRNRSSLFVRR
jgi:hypothetical protein